MRDHVIVCGMPQRLHDFLEPFKMGMKHFKSGEEPDEVFGVVPVLFLWDGPVSPEQLRVLCLSLQPASCVPAWRVLGCAMLRTLS